MNVSVATVAALACFLIPLSLGCGGEGSESLLPMVMQHAPAEVRQAFGDDQQVASAGVVEAVVLPFPERENPFLFPGTEVERAIPSAAVNEVCVIGFIDVGVPSAVLRVQETMRTLHVGDKVQGIEVVAIQPPLVKLRQGKLTWNASLFD